MFLLEADPASQKATLLHAFSSNTSHHSETRPKDILNTRRKDDMQSSDRIVDSAAVQLTMIAMMIAFVK